MDADPPITAEQLASCRRVLRALADRPALCRAGTELADVPKLAAQVLQALKGLEKHEARQRDLELRDQAGIRAGGPAPCPALPGPAPAGPELHTPRPCYVCKLAYTRLHHFYDGLCPDCAELNFVKRRQTADLTGRVALVTGARVKIGYQAALKLLRSGAAVIGTTRFPHDAARRYAAEPDFADWAARLHLHGLDLRPPPAVERFADLVAETWPHLDILINNAAQTVRRPPAFYAHLLDGERAGLAALPQAARPLIAHPSLTLMGTTAALERTTELPWPAALSQWPLLPGDDRADAAVFPPGQLDADRQQIDRRAANSWTARLRDVSLIELLETHAVNCLAPFLLLRRLEPLLLRSPHPARYVVNVSAVEGQFNNRYKPPRHPHTNMAKAALNMLTRTVAEQLARAGVFVTSVDTGWVSNEFPLPTDERMKADGFRQPLDVVDGAARMCDPVFRGVAAGEQLFGVFLKDYRPVNW